MSIAALCIDDITTKLSTVVADKIFTVYSEKDLLDKTKMIKFPAVGIMYEGIMSGAPDPSRQGMGGELKVALTLLLDGKSIGNLDRKNDAATLLDAMRAAIRLTRSPSHHPWKFDSEVPAGQVGGLLVYIQRWTTVVPLTSI